MLTEKQQYILKILGLVLIAGVMGLIVYLMIFGNGPSITPPEPIPEDTANQSGQLPNSQTGTPGSSQQQPEGSGALPASPIADGGVTAITQLTNNGILSPTVTGNGTVAYYDPRDGKFYTIDANGNVILLSQQTFPSAESVTFASDAQSAVVEFPDGSNIVYDFIHAEQTALPAHWEDFSFSEDGERIASKSVGSDPSNRSLVITATDGSNAQAIAALGNNDDKVDVNWSPNGEVVGFSKTGPGGSVFGQNEIYLIGADGEDAGVLLVNGSNFKSLWSPSGSNLLYSVADAGDNYRASLWYGDALGDRRGDTRLHLSLKTVVDKCTFASDVLAYCAVPQNMPVGGGVTPKQIEAADLLYSISLPTGRTTLVAIPNTDTKMFNLNVSPDGKNLYYTDDFNRLNVVRLK